MPRSIADLSDEIRRYCIARPRALDTLDGIAWWVNMQRYEDALAVLEAAVEQLVEQGVLIRYCTQDGATMFGCCVNKEDSVS